jgi:hypothetical protein
VAFCYSTGTVSGSDSYYIGGLVGFNTSSSTVSSSYSTGAVMGGYKYVGGLVGYNTDSSMVSSCYSTVSVFGSEYVGGLVGKNSSSEVNDSYYNNETSDQISGIGTDNNSQAVTGLSTTEMKQDSSFTHWDFTSTWAVRIDSTYPALLGVSNNAPFAFADTLNIVSSSSLLTNDYYYETGQEAFICKMISASTKGSLSNGIYIFNEGMTVGTNDTITYCIGELLASGDTLWGNYATAILTMVDDNTAPILTSVNDTIINEDTSVILSISDVSVSDAENDTLSLGIAAGDHYSVNGTTITPDADFNDTLFVSVYVSDGELNSDTLSMTIAVTAVNDAPVLISVNDTTINEDEVLILSLDDVTASDVEDDELLLVVFTGDNYSVDGTTITPDAGFSGTLTVSVSVSDGELISNSMDMIITVSSSVTGLSEQSITVISVYPNPATTTLNVTGSTGIAYLYNLTGKLILSQDLSQSTSINISGLSKGIYLLSVDGESMKVVKE